MLLKKAPLIISFLSGLFFIVLDQILKFIAHSNPNNAYYLWKPWIGWEYFQNTGVAFSIPFPYPILIVLTPLLLIWFVIQIKKQKTTTLFNTGMIFIIAGATSNLIDRVLFNFTIDYIRIFTSIFNLADVAIVAGAMCCFFGNKKSLL